MTITTRVDLPASHPFLNADIPWLLRRTAKVELRNLLKAEAEA